MKLELKLNASFGDILVLVIGAFDPFLHQFSKSVLPKAYSSTFGTIHMDFYSYYMDVHRNGPGYYTCVVLSMRTSYDIHTCVVLSMRTSYDILFEPPRGSDTSRPVQSQKIVRGWNFVFRN